MQCHSVYHLMMLRVVGLVLLGACSFRHGSLVDAAGSGDDAPDDDSMTQIDAAPDDVMRVTTCAEPAPTGLVACYSFDLGFVTGTLADESGNGRDAVTSGLTPFVRPIAGGTSDAALVGMTGATRAPNDAGLELKPAFTLSAWIYPTSTTANEGVIEHEAQYALSLASTSEVRCWLGRAAGVVIVQGAQVVLNEWQHAACTWNGTELCTIRTLSAGPANRFCVTPNASTVNTGSDGLWIGTMASGGAANERFNGAIDEIRVYSRALADDEICTLAARQSPCF